MVRRLTDRELDLLSLVRKYSPVSSLYESGEKNASEEYIDEEWLEDKLGPEWDQLNLNSEEILSKMRALEQQGYLEAKETVTVEDSAEYRVAWSLTEKGDKELAAKLAESILDNYVETC